MKTTRRAVLTALWLALALVWTPAGRAGTPVVQAVDSIGITVADMERAVAFYSQVLTFEKDSEVEVTGSEYEHLEGVFGLRLRVVRMRLGAEHIELREFLAPQGRPFPADTRSNDRWFQHIAIITNDMDRAYRRLREFKVRHASTGPQRLPDWNQNAGGIQAFYFRDPDGHHLEVLQFPPDKGDPKWQRPSERLFLGIDHTAIVVGDTEASLKFYRDTLGMRVAGESENYGIEQERLNNVFGARLRITALRAGTGPGIEFLEYLAPRDGRPIPGDQRANDIAHWETRFTAGDVKAAAARLGARPVEIPKGGLPFEKGFLAPDPDGHAVEIVQ